VASDVGLPTPYLEFVLGQCRRDGVENETFEQTRKSFEV
jgi:hypothetical protein